MFSNVWSENTTLFERLMEIHPNPPKLYYGFNAEYVFIVYGMKAMIMVRIKFSRNYFFLCGPRTINPCIYKIIVKND